MDAFQGIEVQEGEELEDFLIEIEILTECRHPNIVGLYDVYWFEQKLWVLLFDSSHLLSFMSGIFFAIRTEIDILLCR